MARQFAETVVETFTAQDYLFLVNVPEAVVYLDALDSAIERAIRGEKPAAESLAEAAAAWNEITEKRGRDKQLLAYLRSLDLESIG
jgi:multiple sugar transport system substrate-binding protein